MAVHKQQLASSALAAASYDDETQELTVTFHNGREYDHPSVPREVYDGLISAASPGRYYAQNIKGQY